jgi:hypothetical protein
MPREAVAEESAPGGGTYRLEMVRCGKANCSSCPHGPYWYLYYRVGKRVVSKYIGKNRSGGAAPGSQPAGNASQQETGGSAPEPAAPAAVSGQMSAKELTPNRWGTFAASAYPVNFHEDGMIGLAIDRMGQDAMLDVDGEPLAELLGRAATDAVVGRATSQDVLNRVKQLRDRLPHDGAARRELDEAVRKLDAPSTPPPAVPATTLEPLRQLMTDLHAVPLVRRDPSREQDALGQILDDFAAGKTGGPRLLMAVRELRNQRHESVEGKFEVDRAVERAVGALGAMARADRKSLYPPAGQRHG